MTRVVSLHSAPDDTPAERFTGVEDAYRDYGKKCYAVAVRIVRDRDLAHDVVQEVFEALARKPARFEPERGSLSVWLLTITHHKAVDLVRWQRVRTRLDDPDGGLAQFADLAPTPDELAITDNERTQVVAALLRLNQNEREMLVLAYFGGFSQRELAARLQVPLGTVKSRTLAAMRNMRTQLAAPLGAPGV